MKYLARYLFVSFLLVLAPALARAADLPPSLAALAAKVAPAIVSITALAPTKQEKSPPADNGGGSMPASDSPSTEPSLTPPPSTIESLGSGFVFEPSGYILTNNHVIRGATNLSVTFADGTVYPAIIAGTDPDSDLAVIKINAGHPIPFLTFGDSAAMKVGDWVLAVGNPYGMPNTNTFGIVSALHRQIGDTAFDNFIQTDAAINKGNSGGPLFNMQGQVIGINSAIYAPSGTSDGIGFAIPASMAAPVANALVRNGRMTRGWLGVSIEAVSPPIQRAFRLPSLSGVLVGAVAAKGPAAGKLLPGDVITALDGTTIDTPRALYLRIAEIQAGESVPVSFIRAGTATKDMLTITAPPSLQDTTLNQDEANQTVPLLLPAYGLELSNQAKMSGVIVTTASGPAAKAGIKSGELISQLNGTTVTNTAQVTKQLTVLGHNPAVFFVTNPTLSGLSAASRWVVVTPTK